MTALKKPLPPTLYFVEYDTKSTVEGSYDVTTLKLFGALSNAHNFFKQYLFNDLLCHVVLTLNRNTRSGGYYMHSAWIDENDFLMPEINISPAMLRHDPKIVMSVLVHELCHQFQYLHGKPGRGKYHNKQFAQLMQCIGLMCSATGLQGGKTTGERMSHYIIKGGRFETVFSSIPSDCLLPFQSFIHTPVSRQPSNKNKIKYRCSGCSAVAWGKPLLHLVCGDCDTKLIG